MTTSISIRCFNKHFTNQTLNVHKQEINCSTWQLRKLIHELAKSETSDLDHDRYTRKSFGIPCRENSENIWRMKVELTKHLGKALQGNRAINTSTLHSNFPIVKQRDHCIFSLLIKQTISCLHWGNSSSSRWSTENPKSFLRWTSFHKCHVTTNQPTCSNW